MIPVSTSGLNKHHEKQLCSGFSLIELLAVIGIISVLALITLAGYVKFIGPGARSSATRITILKVNNIINQRLEELNLMDESNPDFKKMISNVKTKILNGKGDDKIYAILARKRLMMEYLPQRWQDLTGVDGVVGSTTSVATNSNLEQLNSVANDDSSLGVILAGLIKNGGADMTKHKPETESAELLYLICVKGGSLGVGTADSGEFLQSEIKDTDGDGLLEIVDNWGRPLRFYRWPTRLFRADSMTGTVNENNILLTVSNSNFDSTTLSSDSDDTIGRLQTFINGLTDTAVITNLCNGNSNHELGYEEKYHTLLTYSLPLVISAGNDATLGLYEPTDVANFGHLANPDTTNWIDANKPLDSPLNDSITNLRLQQ